MPVHFYQQTEYPRLTIILHEVSVKTFLITLDEFTQLPDFHAIFASFDEAHIFMNVNYDSPKFLKQSDLLLGVERDGNYSRYLVSQAEAQQPDLFRLQKLQFISFKTVFSHGSTEAVLFQRIAESCLFASSSGFFAAKFPINQEMRRPFENLGLNICADLLIGHVTPNQAIIRQPNLPMCFIECQFLSANMQQIWTNIHLIDEEERQERVQEPEKSITEGGAEDKLAKSLPIPTESAPNTARGTDSTQISRISLPVVETCEEDVSEDAIFMNNQADANPPPLPNTELFEFMAKLTEEFGISTTIHIKCLDERLLKTAVKTAELAGFQLNSKSQLTVNLVSRSYLEAEFNNNFQFVLSQSAFLHPVKFIDVSSQLVRETERLDAKFEVLQKFKRRIFMSFRTTFVSQLVFSAECLEMNFLRVYAGYALSDMEIIFQGHFNFADQKFIKYNISPKLIRVLVVDTTNSDEYQVEGIGEWNSDLFEQAGTNFDATKLSEMANQTLPMPIDESRLPDEYLAFDKYYKSNQTAYSKQRAEQLEQVLAELQKTNQQRLFNPYSECWDFLEKTRTPPQLPTLPLSETLPLVDLDLSISELENNIIIPSSRVVPYETAFDEVVVLQYGIFILQTSQSNADKLFSQYPNQFDFFSESELYEVMIITYYNYICMQPEGMNNTTLRVFHENQEVLQENGNYSISLVSGPIRLRFESPSKTIQLNRIELKSGFYRHGEDKQPEMTPFEPVMHVPRPCSLAADDSVLLKCQQITSGSQLLVKFKEFSDVHFFKIKTPGPLCVKIYVKTPLSADYASSFVRLFRDTSCQLNSGLSDDDLHVLHVLESGSYTLRISGCIRLSVSCVGGCAGEIQWFGRAQK